MLSLLTYNNLESRLQTNNYFGGLPSTSKNEFGGVSVRPADDFHGKTMSTNILCPFHLFLLLYIERFC